MDGRDGRSSHISEPVDNAAGGVATDGRHGDVDGAGCAGRSSGCDLRVAVDRVIGGSAAELHSAGGRS